jgi:hypothetical protein
MARRLHCYVANDASNEITDTEWDRIRALQHWYSSEFIWTAGKPALKMYAVFPNLDHPLADENALMEFISKRWSALRKEGRTENWILRSMRDEKLVLLKEGGYHDGCLVSGSVRVADNEWNAYLFSEFIVKASRIAGNATFELHDEGDFIRWRPVHIRNASVRVHVKSRQQYERVERIIGANRLFSVIQAELYDDHHDHRSNVAGFRRMESDEQRDVLRDWNWHGYGSHRRTPETADEPYDLHQKIRDISTILQ